MKVIILDRDGVINTEFPSKYVLNEAEFIPISNSLEAIVKLKRAGYTVVVVTNQSILAKQMISLEQLNKVHNKLQNLLSRYGNVQIDQFFICPHQEADNCECRKPKPGMLLQVAQQYQFDFHTTKIHFVGDSITDVLAARSVGAIPVLVKTGKGYKTLKDQCISSCNDLSIFDNLYHFVNYLLNK